MISPEFSRLKDRLGHRFRDSAEVEVYEDGEFEQLMLRPVDGGEPIHIALIDAAYLDVGERIRMEFVWPDSLDEVFTSIERIARDGVYTYRSRGYTRIGFGPAPTGTTVVAARRAWEAS